MYDTNTSCMKLLIVESPAKAKTISKYLNNEYTVRASVGHVRDLPKSNKNAIDIEAGFVPHYEIARGKEKVIDELEKIAVKADEVVLATDPDREGEAIAWHIAEILQEKSGRKKKVQKSKIKRVAFNEITKEAVTEAMKHPRVIDDDLRKAQEARRVLDRLVGYDLSGLIWKKVRYGLSAGRVQSPALRIIMEKEREIRAFTPEDYWVITAVVETQHKDKLTLTCSVEPREQKEADRIIETGKSVHWQVADVKESEMKRTPRPPFTTSTLQQSASTRLGFTPARTMQIAQRLYEAGHITYMRTDSPSLSQTILGPAAKTVEKMFGKDYVETRQFKTKSKTAQEAHEAVRPTHLEKESAGATEEQKKLYKLIWQRTIASQMKDARVLKTKITAEIGEEKDAIPEFYANGSRVIFDGWLKADPAARGEDTELPKVNTGEALQILEMHSEGKQTQPPSRYTEAGLVKELEKRGIGRPSTYASIMRTLVDREYVTREGKTLFPTDTGDVVSTFLENNFTKYISDSFTAEMENELDEIANGEREYAKTLKEFYTPFQKDVKDKESTAKLTTLETVSPDIRCPKCDAEMVVKLGRGGKFMSCAKFPDCDGARTIDGKEVKPDEPIGVYPPTNEPIFLLSGRFGPYVQVGQKTKEVPKPKRASVPKEKDLDTVTEGDALKYLSLPRILGTHPDTSADITAAIGKFGPFIVHDGDFRSLKTDDVYTIELPRALEILKEEKKPRGFRKKEKEEEKSKH
jgi:DNA topoisomerase I